MGQDEVQNHVKTQSHLKLLVMSSSDSFTNFETTILFFVKLSLFIYSYVVKNVNNKIEFREKIGKKKSVKICGELIKKHKQKKNLLQTKKDKEKKKKKNPRHKKKEKKKKKKKKK